MPYMLINKCCECDKVIAQSEISQSQFNGMVDHIQADTDRFGDREEGEVIGTNTITRWGSACPSCKE